MVIWDYMGDDKPNSNKGARILPIYYTQYPKKKHHLFRPSSEVLAAAEVYKIMAAAEALATDLQVWDLPLFVVPVENHWETPLGIDGHRKSQEK